MLTCTQVSVETGSCFKSAEPQERTALMNCAWGEECSLPDFRYAQIWSDYDDETNKIFLNWEAYTPLTGECR